MKVYSLVGKSGTGKSYRAGELCNQYGIDALIDDGLFIAKGRILAGISAKRQNTKYRAIKTALFTDDEHMLSVITRMQKVKPSSVLVIGTSDKMVDIISERLGLPTPDVRFDIEDLTTADERVIAHRQRHEFGEHVIPAPTFQIKKDFSGYFYHPIRNLRGMADMRSRGREAEDSASASGVDGGVRSEDGIETGGGSGTGAQWDHSVVRPTYSYLGDFTISDRAIRDIVRAACDAIGGIRDMPLALIHAHRKGAIIEVEIVLDYGVRIVDTARSLQKTAAEHIENMTSINVIAIDVEIQRLEW
ncbi:MAG: Asp23/Gls24 family envelope stress response protein [Clostridiales Family XIII bacterium]|jgi:uncharacterized alkaline shock family protein YloU|nr:Asp23/Gls24 family envelope stress response protein [Clostridiales Family XIII bacterium]